MARIRSLHPGLFTDDRYMALSLAARELLKGIWCEADDQGVFEWRPLTLKARIMPADAVDVAEILGELVAGNFVTRFENDCRSFGVVRNFRRFQRPKKPNHTHLLPPELRTYAGLTDDGATPDHDKTHPVPHQFPTGGGKPPQMEEEGCRRKDGGDSKSPALPALGVSEPRDPGGGRQAGRQANLEISEDWLGEAGKARESAGLPPIDLRQQARKALKRWQTDPPTDPHSAWLGWAMRGRDLPESSNGHAEQPPFHVEPPPGPPPKPEDIWPDLREPKH